MPAVHERLLGTPEQRVARRLSIDGGHLLCSGTLNQIGQPALTISHRTVSVARFLWEQGRPPLGKLVLARTCDQARCVSPDHHEAVTRAEASRRANAARWGDRDACSQGHTYTDESTYWYRGNRYCRICRRDRQRAARAR